MLQAGRSQVRFRMRSLDFGPGVDSASNEYEARKAENLTTICQPIL
jgi:hypothetical protein